MARHLLLQGPTAWAAHFVLLLLDVATIGRAGLQAKNDRRRIALEDVRVKLRFGNVDHFATKILQRFRNVRPFLQKHIDPSGRAAELLGR